MILRIAALLPLLPALVGAAAGDFNYDDNEGDKGPANWANLAIDDNQCGGDSNSPIALESSACDIFEDYIFTPGTCTYGDFNYTINHVAEQVDAPGSDICETPTVEIPGVDGVFEFLQFHIHLNSEHTLDDEHYSGELHMVHKLKDSEELVLAVIGLFIRGVSVLDNDKFSDFLVQFDKFADDTAETCNMTTPEHWWTANNRTTIVSTGDDDAGVYDLIPDDSTWYNYDGGLTTPPCTEIVEWNVADKPILISVSQFADLASLTLNFVDDACKFATVASPGGSTSRPPQDLNGRTVQRICPKGYVDTFPSSTNGNGSTTGGTSGAFMPLAYWAASLALAVAALAI